MTDTRWHLSRKSSMAPSLFLSLLLEYLVYDVVYACTNIVQDDAAGHLLAAGYDGAQRAVLGVQLVLLEGRTRVAGELVEEVVQPEVHPEEDCQYPAQGYAPVANR